MLKTSGMTRRRKPRQASAKRRRRQAAALPKDAALKGGRYAIPTERPGVKTGHYKPVIRGLMSVVLWTLVAATVTLTSAQFPPTKKDPLAPTQSSQSPAACSAADASSCAQVASKIMPIILGP